MSASSDITTLLARARDGDDAAADVLFDTLYGELLRLAHGVRRGESSQTLNTTALVHEAWIKLSSASAADVRSRAHFKHIAARAMRQVLVDRARRRDAVKRGGGVAAVTLNEAAAPPGGGPMDAETLLELHSALERLEHQDPRAARVVDCRFFGGLEVEETAEALGISTATVKRDWRMARAWLARELGDA